jgi:ubiquinone/menaquinone biosynthesis C-methylase UbiE
MAHKFDASNKSKLDNEWRREHLPPTATLERLGLGTEDTMADIGCGIGYFSIPAAEIVGIRNKVFALDTSGEMLDEVEKRTAHISVGNIVTVRTEEYDLVLPDETVTFALLVNVLHEVEDKARFLREIHRVLKPGGRLAVIEWDKRPMEMGPSMAHRIARIDATRQAELCGFGLTEEMEFAEVFYGLVLHRT